jgi:hypothetical protein
LGLTLLQSRRTPEERGSALLAPVEQPQVMMEIWGDYVTNLTQFR